MSIWSIGGRGDAAALLDARRQHEVKLNLGHREIQDGSNEMASRAYR